jgi:hypothetical protein
MDQVSKNCGVKNLDSTGTFVHNYAHVDGAAPGTGGHSEAKSVRSFGLI